MSSACLPLLIGTEDAVVPGGQVDPGHDTHLLASHVQLGTTELLLTKGDRGTGPLSRDKGPRSVLGLLRFYRHDEMRTSPEMYATEIQYLVTLDWSGTVPREPTDLRF